tara:strand:+ start:882 stop:1538 length:657 start_codon:yes stop_codon:yes gene_type:complete
MKNNFNLDIFFKELNNNISNASTSIEDIIKKANRNNSFIWKDEELSFDTTFQDIEENFSILHNSLKYERIITIDNTEDSPKWYSTEYGYLSSNKSDLSFLIVIDSAEGVDISSYPIKSFKNINKPEFKELKNLIAENYPKSNCQSFENGYIETVYLNDKYKWDKDYLNKLVYKSQKARERVAKHLKENYEKEKNSSTLQKIAAEFNSNITFCRVKNKK